MAQAIGGPMILVSTLFLLSATTSAAQMLETETARLLPARAWKVGNAFEFQTSSEGTEAAVPVAIEYGLTDRVELLVEPVPYTAIRPTVGRHATGVGDVEATATTLVRKETQSTPALAVAAEIKFATARDSLIGSGEPDYTGYLIASKRFGRFDTHVNLAYTFVGRRDNQQLNNIVSFAVAGVYRPNTRLQLFGEVLGNTGAIPGSESSTTPEVTGGELSTTLGVGRDIGGGLLLYLAVSYDSNNAVLMRPGITWRIQ
jgi:hypothetical protein